jgi:hypothetical protein
MPGEGAPERRPKHRRKDHHAKVFHNRPLSLIFDSRGLATRPLPAPTTVTVTGHAQADQIVQAIDGAFRPHAFLFHCLDLTAGALARIVSLNS